MGKKSRFLNLSYVANTLVIKVRALMLKMVRGAYPFDYFNAKIQSVNGLEFKLEFTDCYQSLDYLDYHEAIKLHPGNRSITQELIVGLVYYNGLLKNKKLTQTYIFELAEMLIVKGALKDNGLIFYFDETYSRFDLEGNYFSGLVQGKAASFFLRCFQLSNDANYKLLAKKCLLSAQSKIENGGVLRQLSNDLIWIEEYPSPKPSMVLNGFLFYIIGLAEYLSLENDDGLKSHLDLCLKSVISWMPNYRLKNGLLYSMYRWNLCNVHYTGIMKYQFDHLYNLTNIPIFKEYADFTNELTNWKSFSQLIRP